MQANRFVEDNVILKLDDPGCHLAFLSISDNDLIISRYFSLNRYLVNKKLSEVSVEVTLPSI